MHTAREYRPCLTASEAIMLTLYAHCTGVQDMLDCVREGGKPWSAVLRARSNVQPADSAVPAHPELRQQEVSELGRPESASAGGASPGEALT